MQDGNRQVNEKEDGREMRLIIKPFDKISTMELYRILRAREEVFFLEQGVDCEDIDGIDVHAVHMWYESEGEIAGYLRMIPAGLGYEQPSIGRVLVRAPFRRRGLSRRMMNEAIAYIAGMWNAGQIMISAQAYLVEYYGELGFEVVSDEYPDGGIPHYKMLLKL